MRLTSGNNPVLDNIDIHVITYMHIKCEAICRAIHDLEWYKLESRKARNLILLMTRASEPFRITAGKIVPLTMTTFCSVRYFYYIIDSLKQI